VVDDELAVDVFEDRAVAGGVGDGEMPARLLSTWERRRDNGERLLCQRIDGLGDGAEVVENVLRPGPDRDQRLAGRLGVAIVGLDEVERVGDETASFMPSTVARL
jgi:hypothetical protein